MSIPLMSMNTRDKIIAARQENPDATAAGIAKNIGVSRQLVSALLAQIGLPTKTKHSYHYRPRLGPRISTHKNRADPYRYGIYIPPHTIGALCELLVSADLLQLGYHVFRSVGPHAPCDLIIIANDTIITIEVRASKNGRYTSRGKHQCIAAVEPNGNITYRPALTELIPEPPESE